ncbi:beta-amylase 3, chloroplastic-like [Nymphaea colorata]|nr:beta-amylase 3, chloroplastic-like [Nymphaea colorata]
MACISPSRIAGSCSGRRRAPPPTVAVGPPPPSHWPSYLLRVPAMRPSLSVRTRRCKGPRSRTPIIVSSKLFSKPSDAEGFVSPENPGGNEEYGLPLGPEPCRGVPVFVTLPVDAVDAEGRMTRPKAMAVSFLALKAGGVEGVVMEVWWGIVEREGPGIYDWKGYRDVVARAAKCGLKVRAIMSFHQSGRGFRVPLPRWVLQEMDKEPNLSYTDKAGRRDRECLSLGCDMLPVLNGRSPLQAYSDFMRNFRDTFKGYLGAVVTGIQIGMGPGGELRYPYFPSEPLRMNSEDFGKFQCFDKFMLASLRACARAIGKDDWGNGVPFDVMDFEENGPHQTSFFRNEGYCDSPQGRFFLSWYSGMLLLHGERLCMAAETIFHGTGVRLYGKIAGIHWHYTTASHPLELTAGYYNTSTRDGYLPIARMFGRHGVTLCCTCFDLRDAEEKKTNTNSSPEGLLKQLMYAAFSANIPVSGENSLPYLDDASCRQILKTSKMYPDGYHESPSSFNFVRMDKNMFGGKSWSQFLRLVKELSHERNVKDHFNSRRTESHLSFKSSVERCGRAVAYY